MFEVVSTDRGRGNSVHRTATAIGSVAVHVAIVGGVLLIPGPARRFVLEQASDVRFFEVPVLKLPTGASRADEVPGAEAADALRTAAADPTGSVLVLIPPARVPDHLPQMLPDVAGARNGTGIQTDTVETTLLASLADAAAKRAAEQARREPVEVSALSELPRLSNPRTMAEWWSDLYPTRLLLRGIEGQTVVSFIIEMDGRVSSLQILSSTHPDFGRATLRGARRMRFRPAKLGGLPVRVRATMPVQWVLPQA